MTMLADDIREKQIANLLFLYRSCAKSRHPHSQEMARRYQQELRQLGAETGGDSGSRAVVVNMNGA